MIYPSETEINDALVAMGLESRGSAVIEAARMDAIDRWQTETGYRPFLGDDRSIYLTHGGGNFLKLNGPCLQLYQVLVEGQLKQAGADFLLLFDGTRIWGLRFLNDFQQGAMVQIDGYFGYTDDLDRHVFESIVRRTILNLLERDRAGQRADGVRQWHQGDEAVTYEDKAMAELVSWAACPKGREDSFGGATYHYKNMGVYF